MVMLIRMMHLYTQFALAEENERVCLLSCRYMTDSKASAKLFGLISVSSPLL